MVDNSILEDDEEEERNSCKEETVINVDIEISIKNGNAIDCTSFHYNGNNGNNSKNDNPNSDTNKNNISVTKNQLIPLIKCVNDLAASMSQKRGGKLTFYNGDKACIRRMNVTYFDIMNNNHDITSSESVILPAGAKSIIVKFYVVGGSRLYRTEREKNGQPWYKDENNNYKEEIISFENGDGVDALFVLKGTSLHCYVHKAWDFGRPDGASKRDWEWWGGSVPKLSDKKELL